MYTLMFRAKNSLDLCAEIKGERTGTASVVAVASAAALGITLGIVVSVAASSQQEQAGIDGETVFGG